MFFRGQYSRKGDGTYAAAPQPYEMRCSADSEACSRRRTVASLLVFAKELEKAGRISKASKGLLKGEC